MLMFLFIMVLNFGISWHNATVVGRSWADSRAIGGWLRFMTWCGAIMAACGFSYCYLAPAVFLAYKFHFLPLAYAQGAMELGYLVIILPMLGSGIAIWVDSMTTAFRERTLASGGVAAWNTFATFHNTYSAMQTVPSAFSHVESLFESKSDDNASLWMIVIVLLVLGAGIMTTVYLVQKSAIEYSKTVI